MSAVLLRATQFAVAGFLVRYWVDGDGDGKVAWADVRAALDRDADANISAVEWLRGFVCIYVLLVLVSVLLKALIFGGSSSGEPLPIAPTTPEDRDSVISAASKGDATRLAELLKTCPAPLMHRALLVACTEGHWLCAEVCVAAGANAKAINADGETAIYLASLNGRFEIVKWLVENGVRCKKQEEESTPLVGACRGGHFEIAKLLIQKAGADPSEPDSRGTRPLHAATAHSTIVRLLIDSGASVAPGDADGETAVFKCGFFGHPDALKILLEAGALVDAPNAKGETALLWAAKNGNVSTVDLLLASNADPLKARLPDGSTPLLWAVANDDAPMVERFSKLLNEKTNNGWTALMEASSNGRLEVVRRLLELGADVSATKLDQTTALWWASVNGHTKVVACLLKAGADPDCKSSDFTTALMAASQCGHADIVKLLLDANADPKPESLTYDTALSHATKKKRAECIKLLTAAMSKQQQ